MLPGATHFVDHAFGDAEIAWFDSDGNKIATAYKGRPSSVWIKEGHDWSATTFEDKPDDHQWNSVVYELLHLGKPGRYFRNDSGDGAPEDEICSEEEDLPPELRWVKAIMFVGAVKLVEYLNALNLKTEEVQIVAHSSSPGGCAYFTLFRQDWVQPEQSE